MSFLLKVFTYIIVNAISIWTAGQLIGGFSFQGNWRDLLIAGLILGIINSLVRPVVKLVTLPVIFLTLGLFTAVINIALLLLVAWLVPGLRIETLWAAVWGVIVISLVNHLLMTVVRE